MMTTEHKCTLPQLPQLFADLGGCLGLYIGVSAITIFEFLEHLLTMVRHIAGRHCGCGEKKQRSPTRRKQEWAYPSDKAAAGRQKSDGGGHKPWSFLIRDREYPVMGGLPLARAPLFRTEYSSHKDYSDAPPTVPKKKQFYVGYTVPQHVDADGGFFGRRFET